MTRLYSSESCVDYSITITVEDKIISFERCTKQQAFITFLWLSMYVMLEIAIIIKAFSLI